jgi:hypothetical protein
MDFLLPAGPTKRIGRQHSRETSRAGHFSVNDDRLVLFRYTGRKKLMQKVHRLTDN